jgi:uncharacterized protein
LSDAEFEDLLQAKIDKSSDKYQELKSKNFIKWHLDYPAMSNGYAQKKNFLFNGPDLHIIVLTSNCNYGCLYCQAKSNKPSASNNMTRETAKKVVDFIFNTPNEFVAIEFQGGEPLINWDVFEFIVGYAREKKQICGKKLELRLVSNFSLLDNKKIDFCFDNFVSLCTSLDGPKDLHDINRPCSGGGSYDMTSRWLKYALDIYEERYRGKDRTSGDYVYQPSALVTVSRHSLSRARDIIDEYMHWGFETIFLRPLSPFGAAADAWPEIGYSADEFLRFYFEALDYVIALNKEGRVIFERTANILLTKILLKEDPNFLDLRSPCGAGIGQLAYDCDGKIFTCDEGRMMKDCGMFDIGIAGQDSFRQVMENPVIRTMVMASDLSSQPLCEQCAFSPYCGVCPIYNYATTGNLFGNSRKNQRCEIYKGIIGRLFELISQGESDLFHSWARIESDMSKGIKRIKE